MRSNVTESTSNTQKFMLLKWMTVLNTGIKRVRRKQTTKAKKIQQISASDEGTEDDTNVLDAGIYLMTSDGLAQVSYIMLPITKDLNEVDLCNAIMEEMPEESLELIGM
jgi:hypothetical protein